MLSTCGGVGRVTAPEIQARHAVGTTMGQIMLLPVLAPYKIPLISLVAIYCSGMLPLRIHGGVLGLLVRIIEANPMVNHQEIKLEISIDELFEQILASVLASKSSVGRDALMADFSVIQATILQSMANIKDLDSLHQFMTKSRSLLVASADEGKEILKEMPVGKHLRKLLLTSSFLGQFVLQCIQDYQVLEFEEVNLFWKAFSRYVGTPNVEETNPFMRHVADETVVVISNRDISQSLIKQLRLDEQYAVPVPEDLKRAVAAINRQGNVIFPEAYYFEYLDYIKQGDYEQARRSLHGCFDYMMSMNNQNYYQNALLSVVILNAKFNNSKKALEAIKEAIVVSRENNDNHYLNYLLSWLFNFLKNRPGLKHEFFESNQQLLEFLKRKSPDNGSDLDSRAYMMETTQLVVDGDSLSKVLESVTKAEYLTLNQDYDSSAFVLNCQLKSTIWGRVGVHELAELYNLVALDASNHEGALNYILQSQLRQAWLSYESGNVSRCFAILASNPSQETTLHSQILRVKQHINRNQLEAARLLFDQLFTDFSCDSIDIQYEVTLVEIQLLQRMGNLNRAIELATDQIKSLEKNNLTFNNYWYVQLSLAYVRIFAEVGNSTRVLDSIKRVIELCEKSSMGRLQCEAILELVKVLLKVGQAEKARNLLEEIVQKVRLYGDVKLVADCSYLCGKTETLLGASGRACFEIAKSGYLKINDELMKSAVQMECGSTPC